MTKRYVKFKVPKDLSDKVLQALEVVKNTGKIRRGSNETTKSIERGEALLVVMAEDIEPEEIVMHIPVLCDEKKIPYAYVPSKLELGRATGIDVACSTASIVEVGEAKELIKTIIDKVTEIRQQ